MPPADRVKEPKLKKKPGRRPTSCAECRRLKLKCDRQVPCEKCVSRGCSQICPDGCLEPSRGNRMELHDRIDDLCARIHELEDALRNLQGQLSDEPHPLLREDVLRPRSQLKTDLPTIPLSTEQTEYRTDSSPIPSPRYSTLTVHDDGASKYMGKTARSELTGYSHGNSDSFLDHNVWSRDSLFQRFPPMYAPLSRTGLLDDVLSTVYGRGRSYSSFQMYHAAAMLFTTFALACYFDDQHPDTGNAYYQLARTALNAAPPTRYTTLISIQTMINLAQYLDLSDCDSAGSTSAWLDIGQAVRLGFSVHLNPARWHLPRDDVEKRKHIFWQLFVADTWSSFYLGRPPSICSSYIDSPIPSLESSPADFDGGSSSTFQLWSYGYTKLLNSVMANGMGATPPSYPDILELDSRIREYTVPSAWKLEPNPSPVSQETHFHRWFVLASKETTLMNLHRPYFAQALCEQVDHQDLQEHRYIASIVAIYRSSWRIIFGLELTWRQAPDTIQRTNLPWSQALSATIVFTLLITRAPTSHLVAPALEILRRLLGLFHSASHTCRSASTLLVCTFFLRQSVSDILQLTYASYHV
ncbi:hypothetical protein BKA70DRAFT_1318523 [Coprinopsis sp. MPI-PUGE-AT-0042]|nr:hypothetical protein BKA70DRAFT_1318523 [Coprinopsis sp. MPI-PUGE-AT-0042]